MSGNELLKNIDKLHTTEMGAVRIKNNLGIGDEDAVEYCKSLVLDPGAQIVRKGKNWYVSVKGAVITVNAHSCTIITAHRAK